MTDKEKIITRYRKYISYQKKLDQAEKALKKFIYSHRSEDDPISDGSSQGN